MANERRTAPIPDLHRLKEQARERFTRDLPQLIHQHLGCWVAYHGDRQIAIARHSGELYETCRQQRLLLDEVVLFEIAAPEDELLTGPMAFD